MDNKKIFACYFSATVVGFFIFLGTKNFYIAAATLIFVGAVFTYLASIHEILTR
ncbi:MAG: hypothetical protein KBB91_00300 [Candidatus Pacebacteria bacterium]|jgi:hypothetical protein|nr:hypothetical protein [Candidatus Paceibacterota bacterium]MBP9701115.1 hypothetical protein [Candidatus Paceibacterota bacterium]